ncbi:MAG: hypothetical protein P1P86_11710 [Bacteroidales bacterium]|nr:hypothetical protein [Bacteroidales bacterium]
MTTSKQKNEKTLRDVFPESTDHIVTGAKVFSEKASDIFDTFLEKVKETAETAVHTGNEIYESVSLSAQGYLEQFRDKNEMRQLKEERDEVAKELGYMCFMEYSGRYRFRVEFLKGEEFKKLMAQVRELDKQIIQIGEKLDSESKS